MPFTAKTFVEIDRLLVMLGDDLVVLTDDNAVPLTKQLMNDYETHASLSP